MSEVRRSPAQGRTPRGAKGGARRIAAPDAETESRAAAGSPRPEPDPEREDRGLRRAVFLAELAEAKELRKRVAPRRERVAELHVRLLRTYRY